MSVRREGGEKGGVRSTPDSEGAFPVGDAAERRRGSGGGEAIEAVDRYELHVFRPAWGHTYVLQGGGLKVSCRSSRVDPI